MLDNAVSSLIDLHTHSRHMSMDSGLAPATLVKQAVALGLNAVCVTEHNNVWARRHARLMEERYGIPVIRGMEVNTDAGHVLTFGVERYSLEMYEIEQLRRIVVAEGGVMILAHPLREGGFGRPWDEAPDLFEALECCNGDDYNPSMHYLFDLAARLKLKATGGSGAHTVQAVGRCVTRFAGIVQDEASLIAALRYGQYSPLVHDRCVEPHQFVVPTRR